MSKPFVFSIVVAFGVNALTCGALVAQTTTLVPPGSTWKYLDNGSNQGTAWRSASFADSAWAQGPAQLGYGDGGEATVVGFGPDATNKYVTTYFRRAFSVADASSVTDLTLKLVRDDGAVVYLNGTEIFRSNMPTGTISFSTLSPVAVGGADESAWYQTAVSPAVLVTGQNVLAVEIHQQARNSSDISFDLQLTGTVPAGTLTLTAPANGQTGVGVPAVLQARVTDNSGDPLTVSFYGRPAPSIAPGPDFTLAVIPDTQFYSSSLNGGTPAMFTAQTDWIISNRQSRNIVYVAHVGDIVQNGDAYQQEWLNAVDAMYDLEDPVRTSLPDGIPYGAAVGNHDSSPFGDADGTTTYYNQYFGEAHFTGKSYYAGHYGTNNDNKYELFSASGLDFIVIYLEYDTTPNQGILTWASNLLQAHPARKGIVVSHYIVELGNPAPFGVQGRAVYDALKVNPNLFLMLCGHIHGEGQRTDVYNGNTIHSVLSDYQGRTNGGNGFMRVMEFSPANNVVRVKTYSPVLNQWETDADSQFTLNCDLQAPGPAFAPIQTNTNVASGSTTSASWTGLAANASYQWYASSNDGTTTLTSATRGFTSAAGSPPLAENVFSSTPEDTSVTINLRGSDPDADPLTYVIVSPPAQGSLVAGAPPGFVYIPNSDYYGTDSFTYKVNDGLYDSNVATVSITIASVNDAPAADEQSITLAEDIPRAITLTATDPDGDLLTYSVTAAPVNGTLSGSPPNLTYTPAANWSGTDRFTFIAHDGKVASAPETISLTITPVNDAPLAADQSVSVPEDQMVAVTLAGSDVEGDPLTYVIGTQPANGSLSGVPPNVTYTPVANYYGPDSFTFRARDGTDYSAPATVSITLTPVNDAPVAVAQKVTLTKNTSRTITLAGSDAEGSALTFTISSNPAQGILSGTPPAMTYTPAQDYTGPDSFTFTVSDGSSTSDAAAVSINVLPTNDAPVAASTNVETPEDTGVAITLAASDANGDSMTYAVVTQPANGTLSGTPPTVSYTPSDNYNGPDSFTFTANDGSATSAPAEVTIAVAAVNDPPVAAAQALSVEEDTPLPVRLSGSDVEGSALTFSILSGPANGTLGGSPPDITYTPAANWSGADSFSFTASDGTATSPAVTVTLTVTPVNDAPVAAAQALSVEEDTPLPVRLSGSDVEGSALTFSILSGPANGTLSGSPPDITYTPAANWSGADSFSFTASDGTAASPAATVTLTVTPVNDAPVAAAQALSVEEDTPLPVRLSGSDVEGSALTFSILSAPANGTLSGSPPDITYTPAANWSGADSFSFTASDGTAASPAATVTLTVTPVNDAPVAAAVTVSTEVGVPVSLTLSGSDAEGDPMTWDVTVAPAFGTLSGSGAARTYTPNLAWSGTDQFWFTVSDASATSAATPATVTVASSGPWQLVARTGVPAPGTGGATFTVLASDFVSDAAGRASFRGTAGTITGIWTEGAAGLEAVAAQGAAAPGVTGAVFDAVTTGPWAAGDGEVLVFGRLLAGPGGVTTSNDLGYWLRSGGPMSLVARENNPVPGLPAGAQFNVLSAVGTLEAGGNYAFAASVRTNSSLGITTSNDTGLWATFGAPMRLLFRENDAAPGAAGGLFDTLTTASVVSNGVGQLGFATSLKTGGSVTTANRYGLWLWDPLQFGLIARGGNSAPGTPAGAVFAQPQLPALGGSLPFRSTLSTKSGGVTTSNDTGIWVLEGGTVTLTAREGFQAPGIPAGGLFSNLTEGATVNGTGEFAFRASLSNGGGVSSSNNAGVWVRSRFTLPPNALTIVARKGGATAPGTESATFASFDVPFLASDGGEVFTATLTSGAGGVTTANDRGLWLRTAAGSLTLALREGAAFTLAPGDIRTVSAITLPAAPASGRTPLSEEGRLLVHLGFTDGSSALYHYILP